MSEYQYYEFQAIDKPLTAAEQRKINALSSRVELTSTTAKFVYSYRDFPANAEEILAQHFDAMLYMANWGTRQLMFRFPRSVIKVETLTPYCVLDMISTNVTKTHIILDIDFSEVDAGSWIEGEGWLPSMVSLRRDLLRGDLRVLYLAWLKASVEYGGNEDEDQLEPPIPDNLQTLSAPLKSFVELFEIDPHLIKTAATASKPAKETDTFMTEPEKWIDKLPLAERNQFLVRLAKGEPNVDIQLLNRLRELAYPQFPQPSVSAPRRGVAELEKSAREEFETEQERQRQAAEAAKIKELDALKHKAPQIWKEITALIERKQSKPYDEAVTLLVKLRELAEYMGKLDEFNTRLDKLHQQYTRRPGLLNRLRQAKLITT
ncbi:MAG: hypothetical protein DRR08_33155 [Candidatus Parabeggiatoa sp. nov. 2]|nr:MAG: hypothetical protein B6247_07045 [Beggiatoa sp. 4572_84]RKZ46655.1 MAG: hypothetical protein DRR08_33155 [Gammaproteobacteria bacterium]